jgi:hypothetical protein
VSAPVPWPALFYDNPDVSDSGEDAPEISTSSKSRHVVSSPIPFFWIWVGRSQNKNFLIAAFSVKIINIC